GTPARSSRVATGRSGDYRLGTNADAASLAAAQAADLILIPCRPAAFDLNAIGTTLNLAAVAGKPAYVVLNAVPPVGKVGEAASDPSRVDRRVELEELRPRVGRRELPSRFHLGSVPPAFPGGDLPPDRGAVADPLGQVARQGRELDLRHV